MKLSTVLLVGSLGLNVAIAVVLVSQPAATRGFLWDAFRSSAPVVPATKARERVAAKPPEAPDSMVKGVFADTDWSKLEPKDYATVVDQLTRLGLPRDTVRLVAAILIMRQYEHRKRAMRGAPDALEYWRNAHARPDPQQLAAMRELDREAKQVMRDVVGSDFEMALDDEGSRRRFGNLPQDKVAKLQKIFTDYGELEEQLFADGADRGSPEMRARSALLAKEKRADIERLLTPEELLDYDLRNSQASHRLRSKFGSFDATEAEFRALYPAFKAVADAEGDPGARPRVNSAEARRTREAAERQLDEEIRRVLGEPRYSEWREANDHLLQETRTLVASLNLPPSTASSLVAIQKEIQPQLEAIERNRDLTPNQRDVQLGALGTEVRTRITQILGPDGFEAYKRRGGGWLGATLRRTSERGP